VKGSTTTATDIAITPRFKDSQSTNYLQNMHCKLEITYLSLVFDVSSISRPVEKKIDILYNDQWRQPRPHPAFLAMCPCNLTLPPLHLLFSLYATKDPRNSNTKTARNSSVSLVHRE
jgi:hypothetical protein